MNKKELKDNTTELYESVVGIFKDKETINLALYEHLFDDDIIKVLVLLMSYFKLANVPTLILNICINCKEINKEVYEYFFKYCQDKWMYKACQEITDVIKEVEEGKF